MKTPQLPRFRWIAPDGRRGRWRKTAAGAVMSAVATRHSHDGLQVRFCAQSSFALWPGLKDQGWTIEQESRQAR